jgi:GH15 family glucan-1,4-alpha-glucosidase
MCNTRASWFWHPRLRTNVERHFVGTAIADSHYDRKAPKTSFDYYDMTSSPIESYALIGDCRTAALVNRDSSIDWLCFPRFDSGACFASLLGNSDHGRWSFSTTDAVISSRRRYRKDTMVLETEFKTDRGSAYRITDFMPPLSPNPRILRMIEGIEGTTSLRMDLKIRLDYGSITPWVRHSERGIRATAGPDTIYCWSEVELRGEGAATIAEFAIRAGQRISFELVWTPTHEADIPKPLAMNEELDRCVNWWEEWSGRCKYSGDWREQVMRSLITLKALTYAPTGGIVAAPTTSLPEHIGGTRNWDYRYCWLRDATFTLYSLMVGGYIDEAYAWQRWLVNAAAGTPSQLQIMYGLAGERRLTEIEIPWLPGYANSKPVRVGNAAYSQHQLDVYGEVIEAFHVARRFHLAPDDDAWRIQRALVRFIESAWHLPDEGIWEIRGPRQHFTHSKVMAWVAIDRSIKDAKEFKFASDLTGWIELRNEIHKDICENAFDSSLNSFVQHYGARTVDASLLMLPLVGFLPPTDPRILGTLARIEKVLVQDGFVERYKTESDVDGLPRGEGSFLLCSFWYADNLALQGRLDEAVEVFERLLLIRNDVGLLAEEYDHKNGRMLGNFPQAFSHVGLINTARNLARSGGPAVHRPVA